MEVERYERYWMWAATGMLVLFTGAIVATAVADSAHPCAYQKYRTRGSLRFSSRSHSLRSARAAVSQALAFARRQQVRDGSPTATYGFVLLGTFRKEDVESERSS
jgi:hypothetical protein